jgi:hypothetical protein
VPAWDDFETDASLTVFTRQSLVGAGLLALGAVVVSGGVGYLLGRRQR